MRLDKHQPLENIAKDIALRRPLYRGDAYVAHNSGHDGKSKKGDIEANPCSRDASSCHGEDDAPHRGADDAGGTPQR